jgi:hypothetical protein
MTDGHVANLTRLFEPDLREALTIGRPVALAEAATPSSR